MSVALQLSPPAGPVGNHSLFRLALAMRAQLATVPVEDRRRLVIGLVRLELGEGVAAALEGRCA